MRPRHRADVIVVGGGCTGASIAAELARRNVDVLLLERRTLASGPTGRSTAIVRQLYSQPLLVRMAVHGLRAYSRFEEVYGVSCGFVRTGVLWATGAGGRAALERNAATSRAAGAAVELIDRERLAGIDGRIESADLDGICFEANAGCCDPYLATAGFAAAARRAGARIEEDAPVGSLDELDTDAIVVAAGVWSAGLLEPLGYRLPVVAARAEIGRWRVPAEYGAPPPALADFSQLGFYLKPAEPGYLEVGTLDPAHAADPIDPDACPEGADAETLARFRESLLRRVPALRGGHWRGSWSGIYDVTPDWHPAIGAVPGTDRVYVAAGFSGHGFKLAPAVGLAVSELVCDKAARTFDLALLDPARFERGELVGESQYGYSVLG